MMLDDTPVPEATLERDQGLVPAGGGWFIVNVTDAQAFHSDRFGDACRFEGHESLFPEFGINVRILQPGQSNGLYHRENAQEAFLVLSGECIAIVEGEERPMRAGDLLHSPSNTAHILVGAGNGPCAILMVGTRKWDDEELLYPVNEVAARHGASAEQATSDPATAYAGTPPREPTKLSLPW
jgi:uncharacterized cupin superfamily protein